MSEPTYEATKGVALVTLVLAEASISSTLQKNYAFCTGSQKHHAALEKYQQSWYPGQHVMELKKLSDTGWACRERERERALKALHYSDSCSKALWWHLWKWSTCPGPRGYQEVAINFPFILCMKITTPVFLVIYNTTQQPLKWVISLSLWSHTSGLVCTTHLLISWLRSLTGSSRGATLEVPMTESFSPSTP